MIQSIFWEILSIPMLKEIIFFLLGAIITWEVTRHYSKDTLKELRKIVKQNKKSILYPIKEILDRTELDCKEKALIESTNRVLEEEKDYKQLQKTYFLGSLCKMESAKTAYTGFQELSTFPQEIFKENLDYVLAKLITLKRVC